VIDISPLKRWLLLNLVILPTRPAKSAAAYRKVWMPEGSPLKVFSEALAKKVDATLGTWEVELGMRYGKPSLADAIAALKARGATELTVFPLYPQYAESSTGSTMLKLAELLGPDGGGFKKVQWVPPFYGDDGFLDAFASIAMPVILKARADHVLFSFHGLPERHIRRTDPTGKHCLASASCCDAMGEVNRGCYRAQSYATARELADRLGLKPEGHSVSFQSRLGRTPWIQPFTDQVIPALAKRGVKRLAVMCPAFVADCLETLEEIAIRARDSFIAAGGESLTLVPSLNADDSWVSTVVAQTRQARPVKLEALSQPIQLVPSPSPA
jgi:ferrochelatase